MLDYFPENKIRQSRVMLSKIINLEQFMDDALIKASIVL